MLVPLLLLSCVATHAFTVFPIHTLSSSRVPVNVGRRGSTSAHQDISMTAALPAQRVDERLKAKINEEITNAVIIGGGPVGLATAIMLARRGLDRITVYERLGRPPAPSSQSWGDPDRSYNLGIGGRGQLALKNLEAWERVDKYCANAVGRLDWTPESEEGKTKIFAERAYITKVIARDRVTSCLLQEIEEKYGSQVKIQHNTQCVACKWDVKMDPNLNAAANIQKEREEEEEATTLPDGFSATAMSGGGAIVENALEQAEAAIPLPEPFQNVLEEAVHPPGTHHPHHHTGGGGGGGGVTEKKGVMLTMRAGDKMFTELADLVIGTDGVGSTVRSSMESDLQGMRRESGSGLRTTTYEEKNPRVYKTITIRFPEGSGWRNDLNYSHRTKDGLILEALPTIEGIMVALLLFKPGNEEVAAATTAEKVKELFYRNFPQLAQFIAEEEWARFAAKKASSLPGFRYCGPVIHRGRNAVLLGDAIHTVKPYFGLGLNSGLEDVVVLQKCFDDCGNDVTQALPLFTKRRAKEARALVKMSRTFDNTGVLGALTFIGPIIIDSIFYKLAPNVFKPTTISYMQSPECTFTEVQARKDFDHVLQAIILSAGLAATQQLLLGAFKLINLRQFMA